MVTSLDDGVHGGLLIVQRKTISPLPKPVTLVLELVGDVIEPVPLTNDHKPVPVVGALPDKVVVVAQIVCGAPAFAVVIVPEKLIITVSEDIPQLPLEIFQMN